MRKSLRILGAIAVTSVAVAAVPLLSSDEASAVRFTGGNIVVYRVGSGTPLTNAAAPVFIDEYTPAGSLVQSIPLPTATVDGNAPLTAAGESRSEGLLSSSPDGRFVTLTGYAAAPGATGPGGISLTGSSPASVGRVVGILDANGFVDTSTVLKGASTPQIVRSAVTVDGDRTYVAGGNGGVQTTTLGSTKATVVAGSATSNLNQLTVQGNSLFTSGIVSDRLSKIGTGVPTSSSSFLALTGLPSNLLTYGYAFFDESPSLSFASTGLDTVYLADASNRGGTVDKYRFDGITWNLAGYVDVPGVTGLVAAPGSGTVITLAVTTPSALVVTSDPNGTASTFAATTPATIASAGTNEEFRGVAFAPSGTPGPSLFLRTPATGSTVNVATNGVPVSAYVASNAAISGVTAAIGSTTVNLVKGAGNVWTGTVPKTGLSAGNATLTVAATDANATTTVTRSIVLDTTVPVPAGALGAGTYSPSGNTKVHLSGTWKKYSTSHSPNGKGESSKKKGSTASATVYGTSLVITFDTSKKSGKASITVGGKTVKVDLYSKKAGVLTKTFTFSGPLTSHSVSIDVLGKKKHKSKGVKVSLAALQVK